MVMALFARIIGLSLLTAGMGAGLGFALVGNTPDWGGISLFLACVGGIIGAVAGAAREIVTALRLRAGLATDAPGAQGEIRPTPRWVWITLLVCLLAVLAFCAKVYFIMRMGLR